MLNKYDLLPFWRHYWSTVTLIICGFCIKDGNYCEPTRYAQKMNRQIYYICDRAARKAVNSAVSRSRSPGRRRHQLNYHKETSNFVEGKYGTVSLNNCLGLKQRLKMRNATVGLLAACIMLHFHPLVCFKVFERHRLVLSSHFSTTTSPVSFFEELL